jgi:hypothetical protein
MVEPVDELVEERFLFRSIAGSAGAMRRMSLMYSGVVFRDILSTR